MVYCSSYLFGRSSVDAGMRFTHIIGRYPMIDLLFVATVAYCDSVSDARNNEFYREDVIPLLSSVAQMVSVVLLTCVFILLMAIFRILYLCCIQ